jgi:uncharacterized membrane protein YraQ (UPF0718 family)
MKSKMFWPTVIMGVLAIALFIIATFLGEGKNIAGLRKAWEMSKQILPLLAFAFIMAGLVQVLLPKDLLVKWVGESSGFRGIMIGTLAGAITPGGPYVSLPIVAGLLSGGAGIGTMVSFLTSWSLWAVARLPMEVGIIGWKFTIIRLLSVLIFPPIAGILANMLSKLFKI